MKRDLIERLEPITHEEEKILTGDKQIQREIYTTSKEFTIDSAKMLEKGRLIDIRTHTRFIAFPRHKHNYIEIIYMCAGQTTHLINGQDTVVLQQGDLLFLNQFSSHEILPAGEGDIGINFIVLPEFFDEVLPMLNKENTLSSFLVRTLRKDTNEASYLHYKVSDILPVQNLAENMIWSLLNRQTNHRQTDKTTMGLLFMHLVNHTDRLEQNAPSQYQNMLAIKVFKYIEHNYKAASLTVLAKEMKQSISNMSKLIKSSTGNTFKELLQEKRLNQAQYLLRATLLPVTDIIHMIGYDNTSYFHKIFKERYGISPKEYRNNSI